MICISEKILGRGRTNLRENKISNNEENSHSELQTCHPELQTCHPERSRTMKVSKVSK